uniref:Protein PsbN n=1 Tax=Prasinococcus sp. CCMP1194 TaxID=110672 RepID=A0A088CJS5_9VIRI|nr:N protein of photosystem II [Prasinococcus sp. CCMP1194]
METATILVIFFSSSLISFTFYSLYTAFGSPSESLRDPFDEHED